MLVTIFSTLSRTNLIICTILNHSLQLPSKWTCLLFACKDLNKRKKNIFVTLILLGCHRLEMVFFFFMEPNFKFCINTPYHLLTTVVLWPTFSTEIETCPGTQNMSDKNTS